MTPEERAKAAIEAADMGMLWSEDEPGLVAAIASAIRAAENDALERALAVLDQYAATDTFASLAELEADIRSLKHKDTP